MSKVRNGRAMPIGRKQLATKKKLMIIIRDILNDDIANIIHLKMFRKFIDVPEGDS